MKIFVMKYKDEEPVNSWTREYDMRTSYEFTRMERDPDCKFFSGKIIDMEELAKTHASSCEMDLSNAKTSGHTEWMAG